jgi:hypothetical protein
MEDAFLRSAGTFQPDPEMFVCMDSTGCYHVSWNAKQHQAKMAQVRAEHGARYVMVPADQAELEVVVWRYCDHDINGDPWPWEYVPREPRHDHAEVEALVTLFQATTLLAAKDAEIERLAQVAAFWENNWKQERDLKVEAITAYRAAEASLAKAVEIIEAVAHIGVDFGYGPYEVEDEYIDAARAFLSEHRS